MKREDGRSYFYQWELNQRLLVTEDCTLVQFGNGTMTNALGSEVKEEGGVRYAEVPNILLQTAADLHAYAWNEGTTNVVGHAVFAVEPMPKPAQYAYTQTEVKRYDMLLKTLEENSAYYIPSVDAEGNLSWKKNLDQMPSLPVVNIRGPQGPQGDKGEKGDTGEVNIDDGIIGSDAWSSKNTVDKLCPSFEESGTIVTCEPVADYPLTVQTISDATKVYRTGKNLFNFKQGVSLISELEKYGYIIYLPAGTYTLHAEQVGVELSDENPRYLYGQIKRADGTSTNIHTVVHKKLQKQTFTLETGDYLRIYNGTIQSEAKCNELFKEEFDVQIEQGSTETDYEPYVGGEFAVGKPVPGISGVNYIWADSGEITVTGRADPLPIIADLQENQEGLLERVAALESAVINNT